MSNSGFTKPIHLVLIVVALMVMGFLALVWRDAGNTVPGLPELPVSKELKPVLVPSDTTPGAVSVNEKTVEIYFANNILDPEVTCTKVFPVKRVIPPGAEPLRETLKELLAGPTALETDKGYGSILPRNLTVNRLEQLNGTVFVDFGPELAKMAGSCAVLFARAQIERTLSGVASVSNVVISVEGNSAEALQP